METAETLRLRGPERRRGTRFVFRERRSGFERRGRRRSRAAALDTSLIYLRDNPVAVAVLLLLGNVLSLADLALTRVSLVLGASEANPFMRPFVVAHPALAGVLKVGLVVALSLMIWRQRRRRRGLELAVFLAIFYGVLVIYELMSIGLVL